MDPSASVSISVFLLAPFKPDPGDLLRNVTTLASNYGTKSDDEIIPGAQPFGFILPPNPVIVGYDNNPTPWNKNPINRPLLAPLVIPAEATFTDREKLLSMLQLLMTPPNRRGSLVFQVSRIGDTVYYLDVPGEVGKVPGPMKDVNGVVLKGEKGGFDANFVNSVTTDPNPAKNLAKYFVFNSYSLLGGTQLLVRTEVDCMNPPPDTTAAIKSRNKYNAWTDTDYLKTVYWQMLFGCTQNLVMGVYDSAPKNNVKYQISEKTFAEVALLAKMDDATALPPLELLVTLINWIRGNIADTQSKTLSFSPVLQVFTLSTPLVENVVI